jgi:hypothetical protein
LKKFLMILISAAFSMSAVTAVADDHSQASLPVGVVYSLDVSDPASFVASMSKYWDSKTGKSNPGYAILRQVIAGGENPATHTVALVFGSYADMDKATAVNATSAEAAAFAAEVSTSASIVSSSMFEATGVVIGDSEPAQGPGTVTMYYQMAVSDPAAYVAALQKMGASVDTKGVVSSLFALPAAGDSGITHVSTISGSSMNEMMTGLKGIQSTEEFASFVSEVAGVREIIATIVTTDLATFGM